MKGQARSPHSTCTSQATPFAGLLRVDKPFAGRPASLLIFLSQTGLEKVRSEQGFKPKDCRNGNTGA